MGCGLTQGHAKGPWKASSLWKKNKKTGIHPPNNTFTSSRFCHPASHPHLPHLSLISDRLNLKYSVERLPADSQHRIKSLTVESKGFSLSLHKHESNGSGGGLLRAGAVSDISPLSFLHTELTYILSPIRQTSSIKVLLQLLI